MYSCWGNFSKILWQEYITFLIICKNHLLDVSTHFWSDKKYVTNTSVVVYQLFILTFCKIDENTNVHAKLFYSCVRNHIGLITTPRNKRKHDEEPEIISTRITPCFYFRIHFRFWRHQKWHWASWQCNVHCDVEVSKYGKCTVSKQPNST